LLPGAIGLLASRSLAGAVTGFLWGGLVRIFVVHHVTWSINSVCHIWGRQPFESADQSRDNFIFGVLGLGEGWHNSHHAFPSSARHGLRWWQVDVSYWVIRGLGTIGLASNIRLPSEAALTRHAKQ
jgi:stearoyl-CoA desaturase (delta-9 desaturase)